MPDTKNDNQFVHFSHSPFEFNWNGVKAEVNDTGRIKLTQVNHVDGEEVEDTINTSADFVYRLASMLSATKKKEFKREPFTPNNR